MSDDGGNDNVFARWSRRKLSARLEEPARGDETPSPEVGSEEVGAASQEPEAAETETDELEEPLPRIEDLTAESDLSAFLRKGVPMALKSAAMRKMWSLDPGIRDCRGPSEYAWDFNQPGSMEGSAHWKQRNCRRLPVEDRSRHGAGCGTDRRRAARCLS